jgi:hypothetical protein
MCATFWALSSESIMLGYNHNRTRIAFALLALAFQTGLNAGTVASFQVGAGGWNMGTLAVGDITGDARLEIVVPYRDNDGLWHLNAFDDQGNHLPGFPYEGLYSPINVSPTLYDLDGDGKSEILITSGINIVALKGNGSVIWSKPISFLNYVPDCGFQAITNGFYMSNTRVCFNRSFRQPHNSSPRFHLPLLRILEETENWKF